jgi:uncharacterized protein YbbK (DUF523 family)
MLDKILISSCFLGNNVRYNNEIIPLKHSLLTLWHQQGRLISICPEVAGGLSVPREPAEQQPNSNKIITISGIDVSDQFDFGAKQALTLCKNHNIKFAVLKESSPSCGSTIIYDGSFSNNKIAGHGVTSKMLIQAGINVFSENNFQELTELLDK